MAPWLHAAMCASLAAVAVSQTIEVPAVIEVPWSQQAGGDSPEFVSLPPNPVWQGPPDTVGLLYGDLTVTEQQVRDGGFNIIIGVSHNGFRDVAKMTLNPSRITDDQDRDVLEITSNFYEDVHPASFAAALAAADGSGVRVFDASVSDFLCPAWDWSYDTAQPPVACRINIVFPRVETYDIVGADEYVTVALRRNLFDRPLSRNIGYIRIRIAHDDEGVDDLPYGVTAALVVTAGVGAAVGGSTVVAVTTTRHLTLQLLRCGETYRRDELLLNPADWYLAFDYHPFLLGGLTAHLLLASIAVALHAFGTYVVLPRLTLRSSAKEDTVRGHITSPNPPPPSHRDEALRTGTAHDPSLWGVPMSTYLRCRTAARFPHYSLPVVLFAFAGSAITALMIIAMTSSALEVGIAVLGVAQVVVTVVFVFFHTGRVVGGDAGDAGEDAPATADEAALPEARYVTLEPLRRRRRRGERLERFFFGEGVWVSTTDRQYVERLGGLFDEFARNSPRFLLVELALQLVLSVLVALPRSTWAACAVHGILTMLLLIAYFALLTYWCRGWRTGFDQQSVKVVTFLQILAALLLFVSYEEKRLGAGPRSGALVVNYMATVLLLLKNIASTLLPVARMWAWPRTVGVPLAYAQGATLRSGRAAYVALSRDPAAAGAACGGSTDLERLAPGSMSVCTLGVDDSRIVKPRAPFPVRSRWGGDADEWVEDPFDHHGDCVVLLGLATLSKDTLRTADECPVCGAPRSGTEPGSPLGRVVMSERFSKPPALKQPPSSDLGGEQLRTDAQNTPHSVMARGGLIAFSRVSSGAGPVHGGGGTPPPPGTAPSPLTLNRPPPGAPPPALDVPGVASGYLATLPGKWVEFLTDEGYPYYHNSTTSETRWELPAPRQPDPYVDDRYEL